MKKVLFSLLVLLFGLASFAVTKLEDRPNFKLLVTNVEFGKAFTITQADLAGQIADYLKDDQGSQNLTIRFRLKSEDEQKVIDIIDGGFDFNNPEIKVITTKDPSSHSSDVDYALVDLDKFAETGALTRAGARTEEDSNNETTYTFRIQDLKSRNGRIPIFEMQISTVATYNGSFDVIFNFFSADETISGSLSGSGGDEEKDKAGFSSSTVASASSDLDDLTNFEIEAYKLMQVKYVCREDEEGELDLCGDGDNLEEAAESAESARDAISKSSDLIQELGRTVKAGFKSKIITRKEAKSLLSKLSCAFRADKVASKKLKKLEKFLNKARIVEDENKNIAQTLKAQGFADKVNDKLEKAYVCKKEFADLGNELGLISDEVKNKFNDSIQDR